MPEESSPQVVFVCQHGAFRSRIAAAYFNALAPPNWSATSAGVTPQSLVSDRLGPLLQGTEAEPYVDDSPPRARDAADPSLTIAIDADVPGAEVWRTAGDQPRSDYEIRDEIKRRVEALVGSLRETPAV